MNTTKQSDGSHTSLLNQFMHAMAEAQPKPCTLTRKQMLALEIMRDPNHRWRNQHQLAQVLGICRRTLNNWMKNPEFARCLRPTFDTILESYYDDFIFILVREMQNGSPELLRLFYRALTDARKAASQRRRSGETLPWESIEWFQTAYAGTLEEQEILEGNSDIRLAMEHAAKHLPVPPETTPTEVVTPISQNPPPEWVRMHHNDPDKSEPKLNIQWIHTLTEQKRPAVFRLETPPENSSPDASNSASPILTPFLLPDVCAPLNLAHTLSADFSPSAQFRQAEQSYKPPQKTHESVKTHSLKDRIRESREEDSNVPTPGNGKK